jgi:hypothetical protein
MSTTNTTTNVTMFVTCPTGNPWTEDKVAVLAAIEGITGAAVSPEVPSDVTCTIPLSNAQTIVRAAAMTFPGASVRWAH